MNCRNWAIDPADMDKAIDLNTRRVSLALVPNVNGFMHDCRAVSALAQVRGALVVAEIIQAVACVPVDVKALGIDVASTGTCEWIMGERGVGYLYVRGICRARCCPRRATPRSNPTLILAFARNDAAATSKALQAGKATGTVVSNESRLRLSVSVFNTHDDLDRVMEVLGGSRPSLTRGSPNSPYQVQAARATIRRPKRGCRTARLSEALNTVVAPLCIASNISPRPAPTGANNRIPAGQSSDRQRSAKPAANTQPTAPPIRAPKLMPFQSESPRF